VVISATACRLGPIPDDDFLQKVADQYCYVVFGGDFIGLTDRQFTVAALAANDS
jgi:hypothetical protein